MAEIKSHRDEGDINLFNGSGMAVVTFDTAEAAKECVRTQGIAVNKAKRRGGRLTGHSQVTSSNVK